MQHGKSDNDSQTIAICAQFAVREDNERSRMWVGPEECKTSNLECVFIFVWQILPLNLSSDVEIVSGLEFPLGPPTSAEPPKEKPPPPPTELSDEEVPTVSYIQIYCHVLKREMPPQMCWNVQCLLIIHSRALNVYVCMWMTRLSILFCQFGLFIATELGFILWILHLIY
jgi:hypothetical protein